MRCAPVLIVLAALALLPGAAALAAPEMALAADAPAEHEVAAPDQSFQVEGQEVGIDSGESTGAAPARGEGSVRTQDLDVGVEGPRCKFDAQTETLATSDDAAQSCDAGKVTTNAGLDLVTVDVDLALATTTEPDQTPATTTTLSSALVATPAPATLLVAVAAAGASAGALYGLWRLLKWTGLAAVFPLYSHISDDEILDDPNRGAIYRLIQGEPGVSTKDIADRLGLAWGTVTHHLAKLEKRRFVVSKKYGKYRRYFANGAGGTERKDEVAMLRVDRTGDIAALIQQRPGLTQKEVSDLLGVSSSTILWHVKRLEQVNLVSKVRDGKQVRYYPAGTLSEQLIAPPATVA